MNRSVNNLQITSFGDYFGIQNQRFESFHISPIDFLTNGHDFAALHAALSEPSAGRPRCVIARTVKGKGVSFMENTVDWHYWPINEAQYGQAISELDRTESELSP